LFSKNSKKVLGREPKAGSPSHFLIHSYWSNRVETDRDYERIRICFMGERGEAELSPRNIFFALSYSSLEFRVGEGESPKGGLSFPTLN
jgi:hypothetical protein